MINAASDWLWHWARRHWDPHLGLVANPPGGYVELGSLAGKHLIRETAWFASPLSTMTPSASPSTHSGP